MSRRLVWADTLKGWLMILVIIGHAIQNVLGEGCEDNHIWNYIYSFHMPAFMAISGWFAYRPVAPRGNFSLIKRRFQQLMIPYFIWSLISYALPKNYSTTHLTNIVIHPDMFFWFLWVLFFINVLFVGARMVSKRMHVDEIVMIIATCMLLMLIMVGLDFRMFGFQFIAYYFLFYTLGYSIHRYSMLQIQNVYFIMVLVVLWFVMAWGWKMHELPKWMPAIPYISTTLLQYAYRGITALFAIIVLFYAAPRTLNYNKINKIGAKTGEVSLGIYTLHLLLIGTIVDCLKIAVKGINDGLLIIGTSIIAYLISMLIIKLIQKSIFASQLLLGKK